MNEIIMQAFIDILYALRHQGRMEFMSDWTFFTLIEELEITKDEVIKEEKAKGEINENLHMVYVRT